MDYLTPGIEHGLPITAPRGGIKYPTPTKDTHTMISKRDELQYELTLNESVRKQLEERAKEIRATIAHLNIPPAPPSRDGDAFAVDVKFKENGRAYRFLLYRHGGVWFTTGGRPEHSQFPSWPALVKWLRSDEVFWHSAVVKLQITGYAVLPAETN